MRDVGDIAVVPRRRARSSSERATASLSEERGPLPARRRPSSRRATELVPGDPRPRRPDDVPRGTERRRRGRARLRPSGSVRRRRARAARGSAHGLDVDLMHAIERDILDHVRRPHHRLAASPCSDARSVARRSWRRGATCRPRSCGRGADRDGGARAAAGSGDLTFEPGDSSRTGSALAWRSSSMRRCGRADSTGAATCRSMALLRHDRGRRADRRHAKAKAVLELLADRSACRNSCRRGSTPAENAGVWRSICR